jgi:NodT family efflux transporter outer membrane factor (OMF) lipoprotein
MRQPLTPSKRVAPALLIGLALGACSALGPSRAPPAIPAVPRYAAGPVPEQLPAADGKAQRLAVGARPIPAWWTLYASPELDALVAEGLANSPSLDAARHALQAAREGLRAELGESLFPSVGIALAPERERALGLPPSPFEPALANLFTVEAQTSYTFDFLGGALLAHRALAGQVQQQAYQFEATRRALAGNIVVAAINAAALAEEVAATERLVAFDEERAARALSLYHDGSTAHDDALAAELDAANSAATLPGLRAQLSAVLHAEATLLGRTPSAAPEPLALAALHLPETLPLAVPSELLHQRPDILAAEAALRASADEAGAATSALFPSLTLSASYGRGAFDWTQLRSPQSTIWNVGAALAQPLFNGGALRARRREYLDLYEEAAADYRRTVLAAFQSVADSLVALDEDAHALAASAQAADAAALVREHTEARARLGALPLTAVLVAGRQAESASIQRTRARAQRLADSASLLLAMGDPGLVRPLELWPSRRASGRGDPE